VSERRTRLQPLKTGCEGIRSFPDLIPRNSRRTKIAIDYLHREWRGNAVGFASYGRGAPGIRAVQALKQAVRGTTPPFGLRLSIFPNGGG
jgi:hypothetical protein